MVNYSLDNLRERAEEAKDKARDYIEDLEEQYLQRCDYRKRNHVPVLAFNGRSRSGKDTAAEFMGLVTRQRALYAGSASRRAMPILCHMVGLEPERLYQERHDHIPFMIAAFHAIRGDDYSFLVRLALGAGDLVVGVRGAMELHTVVRAGIVDLNVWVERQSAGYDPTAEYGSGDCDVVVCNNGSILEYYARLRRLASAAYGV